MMHLEETWEWLRTSPLLWLGATLAAYEAGRRLRARTGHALAQPALVAIATVAVLLTLLGVPYDAYRDAVEIIVVLLGPATVALAIPLYHQLDRLRGMLAAMLLALGVGALVSVLSAAGLVKVFGGSEALVRTMAPKAATSPVAIALADSFDGIPELAAIFAILAGLIGAVAAPALLTLAGVRDPRARGLAVGAVSHGIGTARLLHDEPSAGAFAGLSMGLTALLTCLALPIGLWLLL